MSAASSPVSWESRDRGRAARFVSDMQFYSVNANQQTPSVHDEIAAGIYHTDEGTFSFKHIFKPFGAF